MSRVVRCDRKNCAEFILHNAQSLPLKWGEISISVPSKGYNVTNSRIKKHLCPKCNTEILKSVELEN